MGDAMKGLAPHVGRIQKTFLVLFLLLAALMFGGATVLGREIPTSRKLIFWRTGAPPRFDYLATKVALLNTQTPAGPTPAAEAGSAQSVTGSRKPATPTPSGGKPSTPRCIC
jgi:hypothetical protein